MKITMLFIFQHFKQSPKTMEISQNNKVAFTTIPDGTVGIVRVKNAGAMMEVYEVHFKEAEITVNYGNVGKVTF